MKRNILLALAFIALQVYAQNIFEGELVYESYENYSEALASSSFGRGFNGVHKGRLIIKGESMHQIDETTHLHTLYIPYADAGRQIKLGKNHSEYVIVNYCDDLDDVLVYSSEMSNEGCLMLANRDLKLAPEVFGNKEESPGKLISYDFKEKTDSKSILEKKCALYSGNVARFLTASHEMKQKLTAWVDKSIQMPKVYSFINFGADIDNCLALRTEYHLMGGHAMFAGELSAYMEIDIQSVEQKPIDISGFEIPKGKKITIVGTLKSIGILKKMNEQLRDIGIKALEEDKKTTGIHYKTEEEWDF